MILIRMRWEVLNKAWLNWLDFHHGIDCEETMERFCEFIDPGDTNEQSLDYWDNDGEEYEVTSEIAHRLRLASSMDHHAIFKAHYVRNPWK